MFKETILPGLVAAAIGAGSLAGAASAAPFEGRGFGMPEFSELDADGDGKLTREELRAPREAHFAEADTDGDGKLSAGELREMAQARIAERIERMIQRRDRNGDGFVGLDEIGPREDRAGRMFERADADGDGAISQEEFERIASFMARRGGRHGHGGMGHGHGRHGG